METEQEVREELDRLFPGDLNNEVRIKEWLGLASEGRLIAAEQRIRKWQVDAENDKRSKSSLNYIALTDSQTQTGIKIQGFADIGNILNGKDSISMEAVELVDTDSRLATYKVRLAISTSGRKYYSTIGYDEIQKMLAAIQSFKKIGSGVTKFSNFQADWVGGENFSIAVFSNNGKGFSGAISSNGATIYLDSLNIFDEIEKLLIETKSYIDSHLQCVGQVDFILVDEAMRAQADFLRDLPEFVLKKIDPYISVLANKFVQLTYDDEYGTREYGSFYSELDKFISKFMPEVGEEYRVVARGMIAGIVEKLALELEKGADRFNPNMSPVEYEKYCANSFSRAGWAVTSTPRTCDQGADIVLKYHGLTGVVQCKLYGQPVGNGAVQEVIAAREYYQASIAIVISNAAYTTAARQLAATANVALLHHDNIAIHSQNLGVESNC